MLYRAAGIRHVNYLQTRQLWPLPFDRVVVTVIAALFLIAPWLVSPLVLNSYLMPWLLWTSAALGLNLLMGGAGQVHLGYGAVMGIGAYGTVHLVRAGMPFELALLLGGLLAATIGTVFGAAALRVKGLYLAVSTLALQYLADFVILHDHLLGQQIAASGCQRVAVLDGRSYEFLGPRKVETEAGGHAYEFTTGSAGGHVSTEPDPGNIKNPARFAILTYAPERRHAAYAVVTVFPDASVTVSRRVGLHKPYDDLAQAAGQ